MPKKLTVGSCFSGIGGLELGLEWTGGFETKWQIEIDPYATKVLEKHWPSVQRFSDITQVSHPPRVDLICGGFPCQDVSFAGKRAGLEGKRTTLWSELFRLVREIRPQWLLAENVPGLLSSDDGRFFGNILRDLASIGFDAEWGVLSAAGVGAPHLRRRVFILAHPMRGDGRSKFGKQQSERAEVIDSGGKGTLAYPAGDRMERRKTESQKPGEGEALRGLIRSRQELAHTKKLRLEGIGNPGYEKGREKPNGSTPVCGEILNSTGNRLEKKRETPRIQPNGPDGSSWWATEPNVGRVAHGVPSRVDRLKCLGNAVVPQVAQKVGEMILRSLS